MKFFKLSFPVFLIAGLTLFWSCQSSSPPKKEQNDIIAKKVDKGPVSIYISFGSGNIGFEEVIADVGDIIEVSANIATFSDLEGVTIEFITEGNLQIIGEKEITIGNLGEGETYQFKTTARLIEAGTCVIEAIVKHQ